MLGQGHVIATTVGAFCDRMEEKILYPWHWDLSSTSVSLINTVIFCEQKPYFLIVDHWVHKKKKRERENLASSFTTQNCPWLTAYLLYFFSFLDFNFVYKIIDWIRFIWSYLLKGRETDRGQAFGFRLLTVHCITQLVSGPSSPIGWWVTWLPRAVRPSCLVPLATLDGPLLSHCQFFKLSTQYYFFQRSFF